MDRRGLTLIELLITVTLLGILASAVLPLAEVTVQRTRELELRRALRSIRMAIDLYKEDYDRAVQERKILPDVDKTGYPENLEELVSGKDWGGLYAFPRRYLRRIPRDPFDRDELGWGLRSYRDDPDATTWGGKDVYDVYSQSEQLALDGTPYNSW
jgi:general secretion pathway protein G